MPHPHAPMHIHPATGRYAHAMNDTESTSLHARITRCERTRLCLSARDARDYTFLRRRVETGRLVRPYPGLFVRGAYWASIEPDERHRIVARTLQRLHPRWTFTGLTAACLWRLDHGRYLDRDAAVSIAATGHAVGMNRTKTLRRHYLPPNQPIATCDETRVTGIARTLFDCGRLYSFRDSLPFFDSAIRTGLITRDALIDAFDAPRLGINQRRPQLLAQYANGLSENGGESFCYATMLEEGVAAPRQQVTFTHPRGRTFRVDFCWILDTGTTVVAEFDGARKYVDPRMTGSRTIGEVVADERNRQTLLGDCGVGAIARLTFDDVWRRRPMIDKLTAIGVPVDTARRLWTPNH